MKKLREIWANDQAARLAQRLPAICHFTQFTETGDHAERFRFGRDPDGSAASPWGWDDLE
ncbi:hypothetical protein J5X84_15615 [Streptosporangiaceae bacterium NEAU-GS5]|nr:hypothetical protein [Streptosporangiaceae bacterium NEAU-GS5]